MRQHLRTSLSSFWLYAGLDFNARHWSLVPFAQKLRSNMASGKKTSIHMFLLPIVVAVHDETVDKGLERSLTEWQCWYWTVLRSNWVLYVCPWNCSTEVSWYWCHCGPWMAEKPRLITRVTLEPGNIRTPLKILFFGGVALKLRCWSSCIFACGYGNEKCTFDLHFTGPSKILVRA